ncbi:hypothetical protein [Dokdonia sp. Asnod1-B02]|uniref:hypothetical protein n=1 Tax=Dokdonia sp. Asnod1-B02 TaxID=3160573 RepID=UPI00386416F0
MKKKEFKFGSEFSIIMYLKTYMFLQQTELEGFVKTQSTFDESTPCNIYFILKRPRISLNPNYFKVNDNFLEIKYFIHIRENKIEKTIKLPFKYLPKDILLESEYPYNYFTLKAKNGDWNTYKLAVLIDETHKRQEKKEVLLDYEVLYIGQAYGTNGKRTAMDRLPSHSTLQKIYSEAMSRNPDSEIWIMLASFEQNNIMSINGMIDIPKENEEIDLKRAVNFMTPQGSIFSEKQKINFTEAGLIKTFLPLYNKEYKNTFPNPAHSSYSECYKLDINSIVVETDTRESRRWLYSDAKPRKKEGEIGTDYWQHGLFHFVTEDDRYKMFNYEYL